MSPSYLHHKYGLYPDSFIISSSRSPTIKMICGGANFVPTAGVRFCLSIFFPNVNMLFLNTSSAKSIMVSIEIYFSFRLSSRFLNADPHQALCSDIVLQNPQYIKQCHQVTFVEKEAFLGIRQCPQYKILLLELVVVKDGPEIRKYFHCNNQYQIILVYMGHYEAFYEFQVAHKTFRIFHLL